MGRVLIAGTASLLICIFLGPKFISFLRQREFGHGKLERAGIARVQGAEEDHAGDRDPEGIAHVLPPVGEEHEAVGVAGRRRGEGQLERLREVRPPPAHGRLRTIDLVAGLEGLIDHRFLAEDDDP